MSLGYQSLFQPSPLSGLSTLRVHTLLLSDGARSEDALRVFVLSRNVASLGADNEWVPEEIDDTHVPGLASLLRYLRLHRGQARRSLALPRKKLLYWPAAVVPETPARLAPAESEVVRCIISSYRRCFVPPVGPPVSEVSVP